MNESLEEMFPVDPPPAPPTIVAPLEGDSDRAALAAALAGKRWTSVTYEYLRRNYPAPLSEAFGYLTARGRAYFLPAFVGMALKHPVESDDLAESILFDFSEDIARPTEAAAMLTPRQRRFLLAFLEQQFAGNTYRADELAKAREILK